MRSLLLAVIMALVCVCTAGASVSAGATTCAVDFHVRASNLECVVEIPGTRVSLQGALSIAVHVSAGETSRFLYDATGRLVAAEVGGLRTSYEYDELGRLVRSVTSEGETTAYEYDALGRVTSAGSWRFAYSDQGIVRTVAPDGSTTDYTYDRHAAVTSVDAAGSTVRFVYGEQQRVTRIDASGETIAYDYDRNGQPVRRTGGGAAVAYSYDRRGELVRSVADTGEIVEYDYDGDDLVVFLLPQVGDEVTVSFEQGDISRPYLVGFLWSDSRGDRFSLTDRGRLLGCSRCP